jgi:putative endonuclease
MFYVYILQCSDGTYYVGYTKNFKDRMARHERGEVGYTRSRLPVEIKTVIGVPNKYIALRLEDYLKSGSGRAFALRHLLH